MQALVKPHRQNSILTGEVCLYAYQEGIVPKWQSKEIGDLMDNEIIGWTKHGNHRFGGAIGTQRSWKRIQPKKDEEGFMKVDENMELPFD